MSDVLGVKVGDTCEFSKEVVEQDIIDFSRVSGDSQPLHLDEDFAAKTRFGGRIAHGMLSAGYISALLGTRLAPEAIAIYLSQSLRFLRPVKIGDTITVRGEVKEVDAEKRFVTVQTDCFNQEGKPVISGEAVVMLDEAPR
ncbi:MAG TPA: MaoC family dehydratase [Dehalococcoidia bacterium]|nr:MaoC family dehydratase [Dehalococcoidia bacterium]